MSSLRHLRSLMRYKVWVNHRLFRWLSELSDEELEVRRESAFGSILGTVNHIHSMDLVWQAHLEGRPHGLMTFDTETNPALSELRDAQMRIDEWYVEYIEHLPPEAVDELVKFAFIGGGAGEMTRGDILLHVVNHATYHRGHIDIIYPISVKAPTTDLPVFLCGPSD